MANPKKAAKATKAVATKKGRIGADLEAERIAELEAIQDEQERINRVATDLVSGECRYAVIDACALGRLLGVYVEDADDGSWGHTYYVYRARPEDVTNWDYPLAENVDLLRRKVPKARYHELAAQAEAILKQGPRDLQLTEHEEQILRREYHRQNAGMEGACLASKTVVSTSGVELDFEATDDDAWSPYDLARGDGFDSSEYELADEDYS